MPVMPGAEPFALDPAPGLPRDIAVVLCHGFTGTPQSMRPWGRHLADAGFGVRGPRLPGHGTRWQDLDATRWQDWYGTLARTVDEAAAQYHSVFVAGLSMGGTLTLRLAEQCGDAVAGVLLVNPSVTTLRRDAPFARYIAPVVASVGAVAGDIAKPGVVELAYDRTPVRAAVSLAELWRLVRADLGRVRCPLVLFHSPTDHVVEPVNARIVREGIGSTDVTDVPLPRSHHVATLDHDAPTIFAESVAFVRRVHAGASAPVTTPTAVGTTAGNPA